MDPVSAAASVLGLVDVAFRTTSLLVQYARNTQNASADRKLLCEEASSLAKLLERLRDRTQSTSATEAWVNEHKELLQQFTRAYDDLLSSLKFDPSTGKVKQESKFKAICTVSRWSFTKSEVYLLLERITRLQQYTNTLLLDKQHTLIEQIDQKQKEESERKQKAAILNWLSPLQMSQTHQAIVGQVEDGSGRWLLTSEQFLAWKTSEQKLLWCPGIPGAGKTVMASILTDHLNQQRLQNTDSEDVGVVVLYLKYNDPEQTLENLLASVIKQLLQGPSVVPSVLQELYESRREQNTPPSLTETLEVLSVFAQCYSKLFFVLDALDECIDEVRWDLVENIRRLGPDMHLLITSRPLDSIEIELEDFSRLDIKADKADLELFIDRNIAKNKHLQRVVQKCPSMRGDIKEAVVKTAEQMFLLARLHVESLASAAALSIRHVRRKLQSLPTTLTATYEEAMLRIEAQESDHRTIALKTLAWVSYASRSLSVEELQHALAIEPGDEELDEELLMDGQSITALCAGLVIIDQASNVVTLVHYTTKNYFETIRASRFPGFHATITMSCATYLALGVLRNASIWTIVRKYPLACYAAQYMGDHARQHPEEALEMSVLEVICKLLSHPDKRKPLLSLLDSLNLIRSGFYSLEGTSVDDLSLSGCHSPVEAPANMQEQIDQSSTVGNDVCADSAESTFSKASTACENINVVLARFENVRESDSNDERRLSGTEFKPKRLPEVTALHLAASMGLAKVASMLLKEVPNIDAVDDTGKTALAVAMDRGFEKAVEFLVNSGACVNLESDHGQSVFLLMAESNWHKVADIVAHNARKAICTLEASQARANIQLLLAAYEGEDEALRSLILSKQIELRARDSKVGDIALFLAVEREKYGLVGMLLSAGTCVDAKDTTGQTSLHRATRRGSIEMMRLLLDFGAEVDCKNDDGRTAWSANARLQDKALLGVLLSAGANPSTQAHQGVSELYDAATAGETDYVGFLLESGTDPSIRTQFEWAPLHWAAYYGHSECVKLLMDAGAELSPVSDQDATPLDLALRANQISIADVLRRAEAKESREIEVPSPVTSLQNVDADAGWIDIRRGPPTGASDMLQPDSKLSLLFDKPIQQGMNVGQFIYPSISVNPQGYIYQLSHTLGTATSCIYIRHAQRRADMVEYPLAAEDFSANDVLYDIKRTSLDYQKLELRGREQESLEGVVTMCRDWTGGWKVRQEHSGRSDYLFRTTPDWSKMKHEGCRWMTEDGKLLARTGLEGVTPTLCFELGLKTEMQDAIVSCWAAKLWSETVALRRDSTGSSDIQSPKASNSRP